MWPAHPAFTPFARWRNRLPHADVPWIDLWNAWAREAGLASHDGRPLEFVAATRKSPSALSYERRIAEQGEIALRPGNVHDSFNALAWLAFPRSKAALNAIHVAAAGAPTRNARNRARDAATLLDEGGMLVSIGDPELLALWRARAWREAFWTRRADVAAAMRVVVIGHGLLHKLLAPYPSITAGALVVAIEDDDESDGEMARKLDAAAAAHLRESESSLTPAGLLPLPIAALPGWDSAPDAFDERRFDDASVFRPLADDQ